MDDQAGSGPYLKRPRPVRYGSSTVLSSTGFSNTNSVPSNATGTNKVPLNIIDPAPFCDTLAILAIFNQMPKVILILIHSIHLTLYFSSSSGGPKKTLLALFGWISSGSSSNSSGINATPSPNSTSNYLSALTFWISGKGPHLLLLKAFLIDFVLALVSLYFMPTFNNTVTVFANAIVAASMGGGSTVFTNAVYATSIIQLINVLVSKLLGLSVNDDVSGLNMRSSMAGSIPDLSVVPGMASPIWSPNYGFNLRADQSQNTLSNLCSLFYSAALFFLHLDWIHELPVILFHTVSIHVITLGVFSHIHRFFPGKSSDTSSAIMLDESGEYLDTAQPPGDSNGEGQLDDSFTRKTVISVPGKRLDCSQMPSGNSAGFSSTETTGATGFADLDFFLHGPVKKNKRLALVRSNQPLWSTLASSIVLSARQESTETSRAEERQMLAEQYGIGQYSVRYILESVLGFSMADFADFPDSAFSVKVNGIIWPQVTIERGSLYSKGFEHNENNATTVGKDENDLHQPKSSSFLILVYGLTPITQYLIEIFCKLKSGETFSCGSINVSTAPRRNSTSSSSASAGSLPPIAPARPLSPVTTLLDNLATMQMTLSEEKPKLKRTKKDYAKRLTSLRAEIDMLKTKIDSADKGDERNRRKVLSLRESVRQLEEERVALNHQIEDLTEQEKECEEKFMEDEKAYQEIMKELERIQEEEVNSREKWREQYSELESELHVLITKRDKLESKKQKLHSDADHLEEEIVEMLEQESSKRHKDRESKLDRRAKLQQEFADAISKMEEAVESLRVKAKT